MRIKIVIRNKGMAMIRSLELLVIAVVLAVTIPISATRADVARCEASGGCPSTVAVQPPSEPDNLRWLRDNDDDGNNAPLHDLDAGRRADQDN